ncbi:hypothetical protein [Bradyrhizobium sp. JR3.5]
MLMADISVEHGGGGSAIDPNAPFDAHTYYASLRAEGCDPVVRNGALLFLVDGGDEAGTWAALRDPDGSLRLEYARASWAKRTSDDEVIPLGVRPSAGAPATL